MKRVAIVALGVGLAACGQVAYHKSGGWTYLNAPGLQPTLLYDFDPPPGQFGGTCDSKPAFVMLKGDWRDPVKTTTLSTGGQQMAFENYGAGSVRALALLPPGETGSAEESTNQRREEMMLANANGPITVATDTGWHRTVPASPEIGKFIAACYAWRKNHPTKD